VAEIGRFRAQLLSPPTSSVHPSFLIEVMGWSTTASLPEINKFDEMAPQSLVNCARPRIEQLTSGVRQFPIFSQSQFRCQCHKPRLFSSSTKVYRQQPGYKESFGTRLRKALRDTKIKWYPIPAAVGIGFLGLGQLYRVNEREKAKRRDEWEEDRLLKSTGSNRDDSSITSGRRPKKRERIRPTGPWFVLASISTRNR
jgi:phosphatidylserine decarboxylase